VNTEDLKKIWSRPHVIGIIQFLLNSERSSETGVTPFQYVFGTNDAKYMVLPSAPGTSQSGYMEMLNEDLAKVREAAKKVQQLHQQKRISTPPNTYQVGDYVLFDEASKGFREQKLKPRYSGPYLIMFIHKADITCKHIVTAKEKVFHMDNLKPYIGSLDEAYKAAQTDDDQYVILSVMDYRGEPSARSFMEFLVRFEGDEDLWVQYSSDLASAAPFQEYISLHPELEPLTMSAIKWKQKSAEYNKRGISGVAPGDICFVNLKSWGSKYFQ
jgi:hypothetical protein